jgi:hypothetical protein
LLPVKANGEVRLRSVASLGRAGRIETPSSITPPDLLDEATFLQLRDYVGQLYPK